MVLPKLGQRFLLAVQDFGQISLGRKRCDRWGASELSAEGQNLHLAIGQ
jgi:hypothetical protein